jgi:carbonic anhydrase
MARQFRITLLILFGVASVGGCALQGPTVDTKPIDAEHALVRLKEGNVRFVSGRTTSPNTDLAFRQSAAQNGQRPFAAVLTCSDSRLPVERVFDRGFGDIFVVRVAGNVSGSHEAGSIEYGISELHVPLIVVMGHTRCGAVRAACEAGPYSPNIDSLVEQIRPAVDQARSENPGATMEQLEARAIEDNARLALVHLYAISPLIREAVTNGKVKAAIAIADVATGEVRWLPDTPRP